MRKLTSYMKHLSDHPAISVYSLESIRPRSGQPPKLSRREKRYLFRLARQKPKIEYQQMQRELRYWLTEEDHPRASVSTLRAALKESDFQNFRARRRPKIIQFVAAKRLRYSRESRTFNWKRCTVRFGDECSVQRGSGTKTELTLDVQMRHITMIK